MWGLLVRRLDRGHGQLCGVKHWWSGSWKVFLGAGNTPAFRDTPSPTYCSDQAPRLEVSPRSSFVPVLGRAAAKQAWGGKWESMRLTTP